MGTNNDKIHRGDQRNFSCTLKGTLFEIAFVSRTSSNISQDLIQYLPCAHRTYNRSQRGSRESRIAVRMCALAHRHASQVPCALCVVGWVALGGSRVLSWYTAETHGVSLRTVNSPTHPSWVAFAKFSSEMVDALVESMQAKGRVSCRPCCWGCVRGWRPDRGSPWQPRSVPTSRKWRPRCAVRSTLQPEIAISGSSAMAVGASTREERTRRPRGSGWWVMAR